MMNFKERISKLIDVKTVVTFTVVGVFAYLSVIGKIEAKDLMAVVMMVITFFFAKKSDDK
jgi:hypothetical protein